MPIKLEDIPEIPADKRFLKLEISYRPNISFVYSATEEALKIVLGAESPESRKVDTEIIYLLERRVIDKKGISFMEGLRHPDAIVFFREKYGDEFSCPGALFLEQIERVSPVN